MFIELKCSCIKLEQAYKFICDNRTTFLPNCNIFTLNILNKISFFSAFLINFAQSL